MTALAAELPRPPIATRRLYYGWVNVGVAALAMVGTLPGRTQGLGLITEPLIRDLGIDRVLFAQINLWATLAGALFCLGVGRLVDRFGARGVLTCVAAALGVTVLLMSGVKTIAALAGLITLTRGLGQSALSVVSLTIVGQWFARRLPIAMAVYTVALSVGFMVAFPLIGAVVLRSGWRAAWAAIAATLLLGLAPAAWALVRRSPEACGLEMDGERQQAEEPAASQGQSRTMAARIDHTWQHALRTPAFWIFALGSSMYGLVASGIGLFNESILAERGLEAAIYHRSLAITAMTGLGGNFLGGWLAIRWRIQRLMGVAMALLAGALLVLPHVRTEAHVAAWAAAMGLAGGFVMVIFFSFWRLAFGRAHLGRIQGIAQVLTVIGSALGPLLLAQCVAVTGSYSAVFYVLSAAVGAIAVSAYRSADVRGVPARAS
ncbi:MAG: MFS transporter [Acidobacteria bacterium]|nr:MFS transporter [Acidobacteriota bacterium]